MEFQIAMQDDGSAKVALAGIINEDAELSLSNVASELVDCKKIEFNFALVKTINSLGVRAWVTFVRAIEEGREILFAECTPEVIMQINMIPSFQGKARIRSFFTAYICDSCNSTQKLLTDVTALKPKEIPAIPPCPHCGATSMETEELEEEYFAFLTR